jgi:transcriptional regulator with XRE-family HTH domain
MSLDRKYILDSTKIILQKISITKSMMSRIHLRMARAALDWTLKDLADRAQLNMNTISRYEGGGAMLSDTLERIEAVFRAEGIIFIDEDEEFGPGVRLRRGRDPGRSVANRGHFLEKKPKRSRKSNG